MGNKIQTRRDRLDIIVTIPKSEYMNDDIETKHMEIDDSLVQFWTLSKVPKELKIGDRVYFIKKNKIESSMKVIDIKMNGESICQTTGRAWKGACQIYMDDLRYESFDFVVRGFQGFRYLERMLTKIAST